MDFELTAEQQALRARARELADSVFTELEAGSAATDLVTRADEAPEGWRLTGHKRYITGAGTSRLYLVYTRFGGRAGAAGVGGVFVERGTPGFRVGHRELMMGLR